MNHNLTVLQLLLAALRAAHWSHWTSHWQVKGNSFYGDHELMDRLYNSLIEEIDTLAEKIVCDFGYEAVHPAPQAQTMAQLLIPVEKNSGGDPLQRALFVEESLQVFFKAAYNYLKKKDYLSLGMDDFLMSMANAHEENLYLMRQRMNVPRKKMAFNKYNPTELVAQLMKVLNNSGLVTTTDYLKRHRVPQVVNEAWMNRHMVEDFH